MEEEENDNKKITSLKELKEKFDKLNQLLTKHLSSLSKDLENDPNSRNEEENCSQQIITFHKEFLDNINLIKKEINDTNYQDCNLLKKEINNTNYKDIMIPPESSKEVDKITTKDILNFLKVNNAKIDKENKEISETLNQYKKDLEKIRK